MVPNAVTCRASRTYALAQLRTLSRNRAAFIVFGAVIFLWLCFSWKFWISRFSSPQKYLSRRSSRSNAEEMTFIVMGDYGTGNEPQIKVGDALSSFVDHLNPAPRFIISTGDQIYDHGISSVSDSQLEQKFEKIYHHPNLVLPWYITIGNHDCEGSIDAMLEYAKVSAHWRFPRRYYHVDHYISKDTMLRMIVLDTCDLVCGHEPRNFRCIETMNKQTSVQSRKLQYAWIESILSEDTPPGVSKVWKIVVGHWSVFSFAGNGNTDELIRNLHPLLKKHKVHAYFNGHDHCMQHIRYPSDPNVWEPHYFVSGAGGYPLHTLKPHEKEVETNPQLIKAAMTHGFMSVRVDDSKLRVEFIDADKTKLYETFVSYDNDDN